MMVVSALRLLSLLRQRLQDLLRAGGAAALQGLTDLGQGLSERRIRVGSFALALQFRQRGVGLLGAGQLAGLDRLNQLSESLTEVALLTRLVISSRR